VLVSLKSIQDIALLLFFIDTLSILIVDLVTDVIYIAFVTLLKLDLFIVVW